MTGEAKPPTRRWKRRKNNEPVPMDVADLVHVFALATETDDRTDDEQQALDNLAVWLDDVHDHPSTVGAAMALSNAKDNAELIAQCAEVGYLRDTDRILDPTWGNGRFWRTWRPTKGELVGSDLDPDKSPTKTSVDVLDLPHDERSFDAVVLDLGYKLNGTSQDPKRPGQDPDYDYGVKEAATRDERIGLQLRAVTALTPLIRDGGRLLVKTQGMVNGGKMRWQADDITTHAERLGYRKVDTGVFESYRPQPDGRAQKHFRQNYSVLLVFELEDRDRQARAHQRLVAKLQAGFEAGVSHGRFTIDFDELAMIAARELRP